MARRVAEIIEYLEYMVCGLYDALGPADADIFVATQREFEKRTGKRIPKKYRSPSLD